MSIASRLARFAGRPLLLRPEAALDLSSRVLALDSDALTRADLWRNRPGAILKRLEPAKAKAAKGKAKAMEDDDVDSAPAGPICYTPLYAGKPEDYGFGWTLVDGIACIEVEGPLLDRGSSFCGWQHGYDTLALTLREAMADPRVKGIFLKLDTPGGVVHGGLDAFAAQLRQARATGNANGKPVHVFADMACSAGYWIAAQADKIVAPAAGIVGSIGAVYVHEEYSAAMERAGVKVTPIQFGAKKTDGAPWKALSAEALADIQAEVDEIGRRFVGSVSTGRPVLSADALIATQAACFMAEHSEAARSGLALHFVDAIMTEEQAFADLKAAAFPQIAIVSPPASAPAPAQPPSAQAKKKPAARNTRKVAMSTEPKLLDPAEKAKRYDEIATIMGEDAADDANKAMQFDRIVDVINAGVEESAEDSTGEDAPAPEAPAETPAAMAARIKAIKESPEGKQNPALALDAISEGMTLAQFKAVAKHATKGGNFAQKMEGAPKVGLDGKPAADKGGKGEKKAETIPFVSMAERRKQASGRK